MKKTILILLLSQLLATMATGQNKLFDKNNIISYSFCFVAGLSDGVNDAIVAHDPFPNSQFWSLYNKNSYYNKEGYGWVRRNILTCTTDGYHLTKFTTYACWGAAVGFQIGERQNWKQTVLKTGVSFLSARLGREITYNIIK